MKNQTAKLLTLSLLIVCCVLAAPAQATIVAEKPVYVATDHWTYTDIGVQTNGETMSITTLSVQKNGETCYQISVAVKTNGTSTSLTHWYRTSDLALVQMESSVTAGGFTTKTTTIYKPPGSAYKFPMKAGDTWTVHQTVKTISEVTGISYVSMNVTMDITYNVVSEETVTVTAGTFDTLKITANYGGSASRTFYYAPKVGSYVKITSTGSSEPDQELKEYSFHNAPSGGGGGDGGDGGNGLGGMMLYGIISVVIIIVVVVVVLMMVKRKKPATAQQPPAMQSVQPGQPSAPTTQSPPVQPPPQQQAAPQYQQQAQPQVQQYQQPPQAQAYDPAQYQQQAQQQVQQYQQPPQ